VRRTSLVAPLLLILLGALFLARNLYPDLPLVEYLSRYWPFVLIGWGVLRLTEILYWAAAARPVPAHGVSPGEWMLILCLCLFGISLHAVNGLDWFRNGFPFRGIEVFGESFEYPLSGEMASTKTPHVVIENFRGDARIMGMDIDSVKVTGRKTIRSLEQGGADRANELSPLELAGDASRVIVRTHQERVPAGQRVSDEMEITVPKGSSIEAHGRSGNFDLNNIAGNVEISSDNGGVRLDGIGGSVRLDLRRSDAVRAANVKGEIDLKARGSDLDLENVEGPVTIAGTFTGLVQFRNLSKPLRYNGAQTELNLEQLPGEVRMPLGSFTASNVVGPLRLSSRSRDVQVSDFTNALEISVNRGDVELRPGKIPVARIDAHTRSGDIQLSLPPAAKFDLTASTDRGEITNDFGSALTLQSSGRGATLKASMGGPAVKVDTGRGHVTVRKASPDDQPPTPLPDRTRSRGPFAPFKRIDQ
jgi:DUF4097 and DUF4098 domain-containing protein YvlB